MQININLFSEKKQRGGVLEQDSLITGKICISSCLPGIRDPALPASTVGLVLLSAGVVGWCDGVE